MCACVFITPLFVLKMVMYTGVLCFKYVYFVCVLRRRGLGKLVSANLYMHCAFPTDVTVMYY